MMRRGSTAANGARDFGHRSLLSEKLTEKLEHMDKLTSYHNSVHPNIVEVDEEREDDENGNNQGLDED